MDIFNNVLPVLLLANQSINDTDTLSNLLDTRGFGQAALWVSIGDCTGLDADSTLELTIEHSDSTASADFTAVPEGQLLRDTTGLSSTTTDGLFKTLNLATEDQIVARVQYLGSKRYIRAKLDFTTGTGGITAAPVCVLGILTDARHAPASAPAAVSAT